MDLEKLGVLIARIRKEKGWTQEQLAEILNVHEKTVSKWERGVNAPDISILQPLSETLGITLNEHLNAELNSKPISSRTVEAIEYYTRESKLKYIKKFSVIIVMLFIVFISIIITEKYNKFSLYKIDTVDQQYNVQGYIGYNGNKKLIYINRIDYIDEYFGTANEMRVKALSIEFYYGNERLYSSSYDQLITNDESMNLLLSKVSFCIDQGNRNFEFNSNEFDKLRMIIKYTGIDNIVRNEEVKLNIIRSS